MFPLHLQLLIGGYLVISLILLGIVVIGWRQGEGVRWVRAPFSFRWERPAFRDRVGLISYVIAGVLLWGGIANLTSESAFFWSLGIIVGIFVRTLPAIVLGMLERWAGGKGTPQERVEEIRLQIRGTDRSGTTQQSSPKPSPSTPGKNQQLNSNPESQPVDRFRNL